ncbi:DNA polymerase III subunits gamma and tau [Duganella phyllosphaerae]|uniref:DNA polymerase III subunits gamma and tau n=1 Tax=Duganella phyllosphaerae TaxID=762836 RepID=A0A1E7X7G5_9BURK|nr:DNA polymerase III subunits gamma and tau [Duganella phyllosphaerae]
MAAPATAHPAAGAGHGAPVASAAARPAPWEDMPAAAGGAAVLEAPARQVAQSAAPVMAPPAQQYHEEQASDDDMPSWVTEFSDDSAIAAPQSSPMAPLSSPMAPPTSSYATSSPAPAAQSAQAAHAGYADEQQIVMPARAAPGPAKAPYAYVVTPVPVLDWDGNWPAVAAALPLRGVAQQLAMQAELITCSTDGNAVVFNLRVPIETWRTPGNVEKLTTALSERFGRAVRVDTELGPVWYTASAEAQAFRAACQRAAEEIIANDPLVNRMLTEFDAWVVPGSIVPPQPQNSQATPAAA